MNFPFLYADERGVWREDRPGSPFGILWDEIYRLSGGKLDGQDEIYTILALDWEYGEYLELNDRWEGFDQVVQALTERLPGIDPDWFDTIEALRADDEARVIWQRTA